VGLIKKQADPLFPGNGKKDSGKNRTSECRNLFKPRPRRDRKGKVTYFAAGRKGGDGSIVLEGESPKRCRRKGLIPAREKKGKRNLRVSKIQKRGNSYPLKGGREDHSRFPSMRDGARGGDHRKKKSRGGVPGGVITNGQR